MEELIKDRILILYDKEDKRVSINVSENGFLVFLELHGDTCIDLPFNNGPQIIENLEYIKAYSKNKLLEKEIFQICYDILYIIATDDYNKFKTLEKI